jgi:hypothetical protein
MATRPWRLICEILNAWVAGRLCPQYVRGCASDWKELNEGRRRPTKSWYICHATCYLHVRCIWASNNLTLVEMTWEPVDWASVLEENQDARKRLVSCKLWDSKVSSSHWLRLKKHGDDAKKVWMIEKTKEGSSKEEKENRLDLVQRNLGTSRVSFSA